MRHDLEKIRPKLRHDAVFLKSEEGALFRGTQGAFTIRGPSMYELISALVPFMMGEMTVGELCADLDPKRAETVQTLISTLLDRGVVMDHRPEAPGKLAQPVADQFRRQIELIDHYASDPLARFKAFRESSVLMVGNGDSLRSLAVTLIRNGLERPRLLPDDDPDAYLELLRSEVEVLRGRGMSVGFDIVQESRSLSEVDLVVYAADVTSLRSISDWQTRCREAGRTFLPITGFAGLVIVGPTVSPSSPGPSWLSAMMRLASNLPEAALQAALWRSMFLGRPEHGRESSGVISAQMVGVGVGLEVFKFLAGHTVGETVGGVVVHKRDTLETHHAQLISHPLDPTIDRVPQDRLEELLEFVATSAAPENKDGELFDDYFPLIDPFVGVLHSFDDDDITQVPLKAARVVLGHPDVPGGDMNRVSSFSTESLKEARDRALMESLKLYAREVPDDRDMILLSSDELAHEGRAFFGEVQLSGWSGSSPVPGHVRRSWLPGYAALAEEVRYVPAAAVHSGTRFNRFGHFENDSACWAVGSCLSNILQEGALALLAREDIKELSSGSAREERIPEDALRTEDRTVDYLLDSLQRLDHAATITRICSSSPSSTVVVRATSGDGKTSVFVDQGLALLDAIRLALINLVGWAQLQEHGDNMLSPFDISLREFLRAIHPPEETFDGQLREVAVSIDECFGYLRTARQELVVVLTTPTDLRSLGRLQTGAALLAQLP